jgi:hypothetical protein
MCVVRGRLRAANAVFNIIWVRVRDFGSGFGVGEKGPGLSLLEVGRAKVKSEVLDKERIPDLSWSCNVPRETSKKGVDMSYESCYNTHSI